MPFERDLYLKYMDEYYSLYKGAVGEIEEKKSRFIATIEPATSEEEASAFIARMKKQYWDARHNCSAFVVGDDGQLMRSSDDGEPSGTAGRPMLEVLKGEKVTNVAVVVTRYFGGTLLGTGGLIRAYQGAVKEALKNCIILRKISGSYLIIKSDYTDYGKIQYMAGANKWNIMSTDYGESVVTTMVAEKTDVDGIISMITEATAARAAIEIGEDVTFSYIDGEVMIE